MAGTEVESAKRQANCKSPRVRSSPFRTSMLLLAGFFSAAAAEVQFDHQSGFYAAPFELTLSVPGQNATIRFTTNGAAPTVYTALVYSRPIRIESTTVIRAAAFAARGQEVSESTGKTFLFVPGILKQTGADLPQAWGTNANRPLPAHYQMAAPGPPQSANHLELREALESLPCLSIIADPADLFLSDRGIYLNPTRRGSAWERPAFVEMFGGKDAFRFHCGVRIHGGSSRNPEDSPKHSFRLGIKPGSAVDHLPASIFGDRANTVESLVLRAGYNDSWLSTDGAQRRHATYLRDEWMRRSMEAMAYPSPRGTFVHLYLNGLYWGLYNVCEQPGPWLAGSKPGPVDLRKADEIESGDNLVWTKIMSLANNGLADKPRYEELTRSVDLVQFSDFLILNFLAGNTDWDRTANWLAVRRRTPDASGLYRFFPWDAEAILDDVETDTLNQDNDESPQRLFHALSENPAFRSLFAERAKLLLLGNGALSPANSTRRFETLAKSILRAMPAEAARWGTYRESVHQYKSGPFECYTVKTHWQPEIHRVLTNWFQPRRDLLIGRFRERGLYP